MVGLGVLVYVGRLIIFILGPYCSLYIYALYITTKVKKNIQRTLAIASPLYLEEGVCEEYSRRLEVMIEHLIHVAFRNQQGYDSNHID